MDFNFEVTFPFRKSNDEGFRLVHFDVSSWHLSCSTTFNFCKLDYVPVAFEFRLSLILAFSIEMPTVLWDKAQKSLKGNGLQIFSLCQWNSALRLKLLKFFSSSYCFLPWAQKKKTGDFFCFA